ncbi:MAG: thiamine phosphate synthase [Myxococcota bacterium]|nr:thiamine phosphate synthase [Myxococcota bacterium]
MSGVPYAGLHVLVDDNPRWSLDPVEQAVAALAGGAAVVQLRVKHATDRETLAMARAIRKHTRDRSARFVMNDRFDLALACEADAVHLGQDDLAPGDLPVDARSRLAVGRSTHDLGQAKRALEEDIDYLAYGPLFGTTSKDSPYSARGLEALREIASLAGALPVVAIGGIDAQNLDAVLAAGARGIAVISAIAGARAPPAAARELTGHAAWSAQAVAIESEARA